MSDVPENLEGFTPEEISENNSSYTGHFLKEKMRKLRAKELVIEKNN